MQLSRIFGEIDAIIAERWRTLTGEEVFQMYYGDLWFGAKDFNGDSANFAGFGELLILRLLINMLGGADARAINKFKSAFQCKLDGRCWLTKSYPIAVDPEALSTETEAPTAESEESAPEKEGDQTSAKPKEPDIVIRWQEPTQPYWKETGMQAWSIAEVKTSTPGPGTISEVQLRFESFRNINRHAACLLIMYLEPRGRTLNALYQAQFDYLVLQHSKEPLWLNLYNKLGISRPIVPFRRLIRGNP